MQAPYDAGLPVPAVVTVNGQVRLLTPVDGHITIDFRAGESTATWSVD